MLRECRILKREQSKEHNEEKKKEKDATAVAVDDNVIITFCDSVINLTYWEEKRKRYNYRW